MGQWLNAVLGPRGSGKTALVVRRFWNVRRREPHKLLLSNNPIYLPFGDPVRLYEDVSEVLEATDAEILIDEAGSKFNSRLWGKTSKDVLFWLDQLRKRRVRVWYTAPHASVDKLIRDTTDSTYWLESFRAFGFMVYAVYDGFGNQGSPVYRSWYWLNPKLLGLYDTEFIVKI